MSSQLSYRLHGREQRPKTLRKHYRDELDTGQVKASAKEPRACSARRLVMGRSQFSARAPTASSGAFAHPTADATLAKSLRSNFRRANDSAVFVELFANMSGEICPADPDRIKPLDNKLRLHLRHLQCRCERGGESGEHFLRRLRRRYNPQPTL